MDIQFLNKGGVNTSDATATADDVIAPNTAYVKGEKIEGTIVIEKKEEGSIVLNSLASNDVFTDYNYNNSINSDDLIAISKGSKIYIYQLNSDYTLTEKCSYDTDNGYDVATVLLTDGVSVNNTKHYLLIYSTAYEGTNYGLVYHNFKELVCKADNTYEIIDTSITATINDGFSNGPFLVSVVAKKTSINTFVIAEIGGGNSSNLFIYYVVPDSNGNFTNDKVKIATYSGSRDNVTYNFKFLNSVEPKLFCRASKFNENCIFNITSSGNVISQYSFSTSIDGNLFSICYDEDDDLFIECEKEDSTISFYKMIISNNALIKDTLIGTISDDNSSDKIVLDYYKGFLNFQGINSNTLIKQFKTFKLNTDSITLANSISNHIRSVGYYNTKCTNPYLRVDQDYCYNGKILITGIDNSYIVSFNANKTTITQAIIHGDSLVNTFGATAVDTDILTGKTGFVDNRKITGAMPNNGELNYTPSTEEQIIPSGYTSGGTIQPMTAELIGLTPEILKAGETVLGVEGNNDYNTKIENYNSGEVYKYITEIQEIDFSGKTNLSRAFYSFTNLSKLPSCLDTTSATNMSYMFAYMQKLIEIPTLDTSNVTNISSMFDQSAYIKKIPKLNGINIINLVNAFSSCKALEEFEGIENLGAGYTSKTQNYVNYTLDLSSSTLLTHDSLVSIINNLYDLNLTYDVANGGTLYSQKLILGSTNLAKLSEEEITVATDKGWNVT